MALGVSSGHILVVGKHRNTHYVIAMDAKALCGLPPAVKTPWRVPDPDSVDADKTRTHCPNYRKKAGATAV